MNSDKVYQEILKMRITSSRLAKERMLTNIPKGYLLYTYHPHWMYGFSKTSVINLIKGEGGNRITKDSLRLLQNLRDKKLTGNQAISIVSSHIKSLTHWSAELFKCMLTKDFKCGVGAKSVLKISPQLFPSEFCMKAEEYDEYKHKLILPCYGNPKIDGLRGVLRDNLMRSSSGRIYKGLDHIIKEFHRHGELENKIWDGELEIPGLPFETMSGLIRSNKPTPGARFRVFDALHVPSDFLRPRINAIQNTLSGFIFSTAVPYHELNSLAEVDTYHEYCIKKKYEGTMLKNKICPYQYKTSFNWLKRKKNSTVDLKVVRVEEGKGKYKNMVGSLILEDGSRCGTGISDQQRWDWFIGPSKIVGKIVEVEFMEKTGRNNKQRHPTLKRIRYDKQR